MPWPVKASIFRDDALSPKTQDSFQISPSLSLPVDTMTDTIGVVAIKGAGKSYTFLVMVEEMVRLNLPVVVLDPVGVCWGLRASADGKSEGLPVVIVGGEHGDVPLEEGSGAALADVAITERRPMVLDLSGLPTKAAVLRFALDFFEHLYRNATREPIHVVLDECDEFTPQKPFGEETRLLRAVEVLVRRGRARGIGVTLVTQRPAIVSKNVLTQCSTLIVGRITSPQDRKAVDEWVVANGTEAQRRQLWASLASLPTPDKWVWAPQRNVFQRVRIRRRTTFDSSATPKVGEPRVEPEKLAVVDVESLRARLSRTNLKTEEIDAPKTEGSSSSKKLPKVTDDSLFRRYLLESIELGERYVDLLDRAAAESVFSEIATKKSSKRKRKE